MKRPLTWLLKLFFAASCGFAVPARSFASAEVFRRGALFSLAALGKIVTGFWALPLTYAPLARTLAPNPNPQPNLSPVLAPFSLAALGEIVTGVWARPLTCA